MKRLAVISLALAIAGCGGETIDGDSLEEEIRADADTLNLVLDGVDCPSPDVEEGAKFTCTVTIKGDPRDVEVVQTDDDGGVSYPRAALQPEGPAVNDVAADEASIESVMDALKDDITSMCDYATKQYRAELTEGESCAEVVLDEYPEPFPSDYEISVTGDHAAVVDDRHTVTLERQKDGSWLITDVK
jgi:hypothetical protein